MNAPSDDRASPDIRPDPPRARIGLAWQFAGAIAVVAGVLCLAAFALAAVIEQGRATAQEERRLDAVLQTLAPVVERALAEADPAGPDLTGLTALLTGIVDRARLASVQIHYGGVRIAAAGTASGNPPERGLHRSLALHHSAQGSNPTQDQPWTLIVASLPDALAGWWQPALATSLMVLAGSVVVAILLLALLRRLVTRPLHHLASTISAWSEELTQPLLPSCLAAGPSATTRLATGAALAEVVRALNDLRQGFLTSLADLQARMARFRDFAEASGDALWETDTDHRLTYIGRPGIVSSTQAPTEVMFQQRWDLAIDRLDSAKWDAHREDLGAHRPFRDLHYPVRSREGVLWLRVSGRPAFDASGAFLGYRGVTTEVTAQARQEEELRVLTERFALAVRATGIGVFDIDLDNGRVQWNDSMEALYSIAPGGFGGNFQDWQAFIHPDDLLDFANAIRDCIAERTGLVTRVRIRRADGKVRVMQFRTGILPNPDGRVTRLIGINRDVTEEHEAQESQAALSERLTLATAAAGIGIFDLDLKTLTAEWDPNMAALYGLSLDAFDGTLRSWRRHIDRNDIKRLNAAFLAHRHSREPHATTLRITRADGQVRVLQEYAIIRHDMAGEPARIIGVNWDITEEQNAQAALHRLTDRLTLSTRTAGIGFCDFEEATGSAVWDDTIRLIHGVPADLPATKANWLALLEPADRDRAEVFIRERYVTRSPGTLQYRIWRSDGALRDIEIHIAPDLDQDGKVVRLLGAAWDITDEREVQRQLRQARDSAREASLAKDRFLATMSHELRTPLNAILGFSEVIRDEAVGPLGTRAYREYAQDIHRSGEHLLSLVNDLIDTARVQSATVRLSEGFIPLAELLAKVPPLLGGAHFEQVVAPGLQSVRLHCDPRLLAQVLVNLVSNARKHSPPDTPALLDAGLMTGGAIAIWVSDEGPGIAAKEQRHVLEPFGRRAATEEAAVPGAGLGLAIARSFVEAHGGQLFLHSAPGLGTTVGMILPAERLSWPDEAGAVEPMPELGAGWPMGPCHGCLTHEAGRLVRGGDADGLLLEHAGRCILTGADGDLCAQWGEQVLRAVAGPDALADHARGVQAFATTALPVDGTEYRCLVEVRRGGRTACRAFVTPLTMPATRPA